MLPKVKPAQITDINLDAINLQWKNRNEGKNASQYLRIIKRKDIFDWSQSDMKIRKLL